MRLTFLQSRVLTELKHMFYQHRVRVRARRASRIRHACSPAQPKDKGGGDVRNTARRAATGVVKPKDYGLNQDTIDRWKGRLEEPEAYEAELSKAEERADLICGAIGCSGSC